MQPSKSRPVDANEVAARLLEALNGSASPAKLPQRPPSPSRSPTPDPETVQRELHIRDLEDEKLCYHKLVADGGRPWYPLDRLDEVSKDPANHQDILKFWTDDPSTDFSVFSRQDYRWTRFRQWQRDNHEAFDGERELELYKAQCKFTAKLMGKDPAVTETEKWRTNEFERQRNQRQWHYRLWVEDGVSGKEGADRFSTYEESMRARLARHGFDRPFQLHQDARLQDKMATWAEYLNLEYWFYDGLVRTADEDRKRHEEARQELIAAKLLIPGETPESIQKLEFELDWKVQCERDDAAVTKRTAEKEVSAALDALGRLGQGPDRQEHEFTLLQAQSRLNIAIDTVKNVERRDAALRKFVRTGSNLRFSNSEVAKHEILLRWIRDQVPLIEAELAEASKEARPARMRKGTHGEDDLPAEENRPKKQKMGATEESRPKKRKTDAKEDDLPAEKTRLKMRKTDANEDDLAVDENRPKKQKTKAKASGRAMLPTETRSSARRRTHEVPGEVDPSKVASQGDANAEPVDPKAGLPTPSKEPQSLRRSSRIKARQG